MAQANINGAVLEYAEVGSGEPLVLVHGSASDDRTWHHQRKAFAEHFRVISYSRRYHWPNEPIPEGVDYAMGEHLDDLEALVRSLDAAPAHLVGHSYGAFLCLLLAIREPSLVRTLVLAEPPAITLFVSDPPRPLELLKLLASRPRTAAAIIKFGAKTVAPATKDFERGALEAGTRRFVDAVLGTGAYDRLPDSQKAKISDNATSLKAEMLGSGLAPLDAVRVQKVEIPTLLVDAENTTALFRHVTDRLEELLPQTERIVIPGAAHQMHEDNWSAYNDAVLSFVQKHSLSA